MKRRTLLARWWSGLGLGWGLSLLNGLSPAEGSQRLDLASLKQVQEQGFVLFPSTALGPVALLWDATREQVVALDPRCPHRGCTVRPTSQEALLICPCHRALFARQGQWIGGRRRTGSLQRYAVQVREGRVAVLSEKPGLISGP